MKLFKINLSLVFTLVITLLVSCSEKIIDVDKLQDRNGVYYEINETMPFSGTAVEKYRNGQIKKEIHFKDGKNHGHYSLWYENGQIQIELNWKDGQMDGVETWWYENGQKEKEENYKDGELVRTVKWDKFGRKREAEWVLGERINLYNFLELQLKEVLSDLTEVEKTLHQFQEQEQIYELDDNAKLILNQLSQVETRYINIKAELLILQERKRYVWSKLSQEEIALIIISFNPMDNRLVTLRKRIVQKEADLVTNTSLYGEKHKTVLTIQSEITQLEQELESQINELISQETSVVDPLKYRHKLINRALTFDFLKASLQPRIKQYKELVDKYSQELNILPAKSLQFTRLERDRRVLADTYVVMRIKLEEARISQASELY